MSRAVQRFFEDLFRGDLVAWTFVGIISGIFLLFCLFWLKVARDLRKEDEARKRKQPGKGGPKRPNNPPPV
jgi:hypothetical protein